VKRVKEEHGKYLKGQTCKPVGNPDRKPPPLEDFRDRAEKLKGKA
jgi:hypothetical protein